MSQSSNQISQAQAYVESILRPKLQESTPGTMNYLLFLSTYANDEGEIPEYIASTQSRIPMKAALRECREYVMGVAESQIEFNKLSSEAAPEFNAYQSVIASLIRASGAPTFSSSNSISELTSQHARLCPTYNVTNIVEHAYNPDDPETAPYIEVSYTCYCGTLYEKDMRVDAPTVGDIVALMH